MSAVACLLGAMPLADIQLAWASRHSGSLCMRMTWLSLRTVCRDWKSARAPAKGTAELGHAHEHPKDKVCEDMQGTAQ